MYCVLYVHPSLFKKLGPYVINLGLKQICSQSVTKKTQGRNLHFKQGQLCPKYNKLIVKKKQADNLYIKNTKAKFKTSVFSK